MKQRTLKLLIQLFAICVLNASTACAKENTNLEEEVAILNVIYDYLFQNNDSSLQRNASYYFLESNNSKDPPIEVLRKFSNYVPIVKMVSESVIDRKTGVYDKTTGQKGIIFSIQKIHWPSDRDRPIIVECGYFEGSRSAATYRLELQKKNDIWVVVKRRTIRIS